VVLFLVDQRATPSEVLPKQLREQHIQVG
jgi:hypothetical protein